MPRKRRCDDAEMDITPMIDITFLLLIFFLVASTMEEGATLELPEAQHGTAVTTKNSVVISLKAAGEGRAEIYKGEVVTAAYRLRSSDLADQESELAAYVEEELAGGKEQVLLRAEATVKHREVNRVMKAIGAAGDTAIYVAVLETR